MSKNVNNTSQTPCTSMTITYICPGLLKVAVNCNMNIGLTRASQRVNQWPTLTFKHNMVFYFATYWSFNLMYWVPKFILQILSQACAYFVWLNIVLHNIDYMADFPVTLAKKKIILIERGRWGSSFRYMTKYYCSLSWNKRLRRSSR